MHKKLIIPFLIIAIGVIWLLNVLKLLPDIDWFWTIGLAAAGILSMVTGGLNKVTVVVGPFLLIASVSSVLRQTGRLHLNYEIPILVIIFGLLILISQILPLKTPEMLQRSNDNP